MFAEQLQQINNLNTNVTPQNPYESGIDAHSKDNTPTDGGTASTVASKRDSMIATDGTTIAEILDGLSNKVAESGGIPKHINVNYDEKAKEEINRQRWEITKLQQTKRNLEQQLKEKEIAKRKKKNKQEIQKKTTKNIYIC